MSRGCGPTANRSNPSAPRDTGPTVPPSGKCCAQHLLRHSRSRGARTAQARSPRPRSLSRVYTPRRWNRFSWQTGSTAMRAASVNIGGVANITYIDGETLIACDTGPGNALLDDYLLRHTGKAMDRDGLIAAQGDPDMDWIARALEHPFFDRPAPKSLDRNDFVSFTVEGMTLEDGAATRTAFTAASIAGIVEQLPNPPSNWVVVGGGANNPTLMRMLSERLAPIPVVTGHDLGWQGDAIEAQAFAYLAVRSLEGLPLTYPGTTGVRAPLTGGVLVRS